MENTKIQTREKQRNAFLFNDECKKTESSEGRGRGGPGPLNRVIEKN